jgi:hypothetical protein
MNIPLDFTKDQIFELFETQDKKHFKKRGRFLYRPATKGETILTIVVGKLETLKKAQENEIVLRNIEIGSSAETYCIEKKIFDKRYDITEEQHLIDNQLWIVCVAKGQIETFCYIGPTLRFMAPWNEQMICQEGDWIARPLGGDKFDIYRIEKDTFAQTYQEMTKD